MDPVMARKMWRTFEPYHALVYFSEQAGAAYAALGLPPHAGYFASRAAPMGAVSAEVVTATFYNFHPSRIRAAIPQAWDHASPETIVEARLKATDAALREVLGDETVTSPEMERAAETAREAALACTPEGRPLFAGHAGLDWPEQPHLVLWHAVTLLREFRGDGHITALVLAGVDPCEALITYGATQGATFPADVLKLTRGWPDEEWEAAADRLRERGWLDADGALTPEGLGLRDQVEEMTDTLSLAPWETIGEDRCDSLRQAVRPWSKAVAGSGAFGRPPLGLD